MTGRAENRKYHYFYKITNNVNGHFYYGVHNTDDLDDGYMGSGKRLQFAYKKYGIDNFSKEIIKFFDTSKEAFEYESDVVTENLVKEASCYNCELGGVFIDTTGFASVKDKNGNRFLVDVEDIRYKNGELVGATKGKVVVKDSDGKNFMVEANDERYLCGELKSIHVGKVVVKNKYGDCFAVSVNDERYVNGELKNVWAGRKHSPETIEKMRKAHKETAQWGEKNSQYGTRWINNGDRAIKVRKEALDEYLNNGWSVGRKIKNEL